MDDSSPDGGPENDTDWILYRDRPEWNDVEPLPQDDGPYPIVQIAYSDKFKDLFDYFRAVLHKNELSERAFDLSTDAANMNPHNYTVWHFRRVLLKGLDKDLKKELEFVGKVIEDSPKNYQVWYHRQVLVEWLQDPSEEESFTRKMLLEDAKNYHCWQHRQWVLKNFNLLENEKSFVDELLNKDIRNNSAWNQRYFVVKNSKKFSDEIKEYEIKYTLAKIKEVPHNESAWNYMRGILSPAVNAEYKPVLDFCEEMYTTGCRSPYLLAFMIDYSQESLDKSFSCDNMKRVLELCNSLATEHDTIRSEYWKYISSVIANKFENKLAKGDIGDSAAAVDS